MSTFTEYLRKEENQEKLRKNIKKYNETRNESAKLGEAGRLLNDIPPLETLIMPVTKTIYSAIANGNLTQWFENTMKAAAIALCDRNGNLKPEIQNLLIENGLDKKVFTPDFTKSLISSVITNQYGEAAIRITAKIPAKDVDNPETLPLRMLGVAQKETLTKMPSIDAKFMEHAARDLGATTKWITAAPKSKWTSATPTNKSATTENTSTSSESENSERSPLPSLKR